MIINIRGTNGSGKTTCVHKVLDLSRQYTGQEPMLQNQAELGVDYTYFRLPNRTRAIVLGEYLQGYFEGCDEIRIQDQICDMVRWGTKQDYLVLFEGVIVSTIFQRYLDLDRELSKKSETCWVFLETPVDECLRRIQIRNGGKSIKEELIRNKFRSIQRVQEKAKSAGCWVETFPGPEEFFSWLKRVVLCLK